jgi:hypothetical protein
LNFLWAAAQAGRYEAEKSGSFKLGGGCLEFGFYSGLLAEFIGGDSIELFVSLDGNDLFTVGVNGVIGPLP